jgi:hypothetical protein
MALLLYICEPDKKYGQKLWNSLMHLEAAGIKLAAGFNISG